MLPMVVAGGLLIALSFMFGITAFEEKGTLAAALKTVGDHAFTLMVPLLAGWSLPSQEIHAVYPSPRLVPAKVNDFIAWLQGQFSASWWSDGKAT